MKLDTTPTSLPRRKPIRHRGFTLVELLVVITIIVVMAGVILVVVRNIRTKAYQANAMSNLRQVAAMGAAYSTENNGQINTLRWKEDKQTEGRNGRYAGDSFWGRLQPYLFPELSLNNQKELKTELALRLGKLFNTPDAGTMAGTLLDGAKIYHDGSGLPVPFGFNNNLHKWGQYLTVSGFGDPASVLYATYGYGFFDEADGQTYVPMPRDRSMPKNNIYYQDDRKAIAAFLDGHVELIQAPIPDRNFK